jgi:Sec-independent protein translocase protein TatA
MDLLGVGPLELIFILLIVFLVLGPNDLAATGKKVGRFLSTVRKSEFWRGVTQVTKEMRDLPTTLMREAELEDAKKEIEKDFKDVRQISREFGQGELREIEQDLQTNLNIEDHKIAPPSIGEADQEALLSEESEAETQEENSEEDTNA